MHTGIDLELINADLLCPNASSDPRCDTGTGTETPGTGTGTGIGTGTGTGTGAGTTGEHIIIII